RLGLRTMLESEDGISVVGTSGTAAEAIAAVGELSPDVVLMDLRMPEMEGTQAIAELRRVYPSVRVLVLTNYESDEYITKALQAGALGYLVKNTPQEEIVRAVEKVARNERCIPPRIAQKLVETVGREPLSQRELEVLTLVAKGLTNKEIAQRLFISDKTARNHVANCLMKLGAGDRTEATTTAIIRGLIRLTD
ncbi:MAG TPA: response regulator transcription factor, partial [Acidobacteriaceae bacterium]|nr:response regulator transcription factor [Acidobacteriaceae bacterium]